MGENYWTNSLQQRVSRRRALAFGGATAAGTALLAACGSGSNSSGSKAPASSLVAPPVDETKSLQRGGTYKFRSANDPPTFEVHTFVNSPGTTGYCYDTLFYIKEGYMDRENGDIGGAVAESWEFSPDKMTLTAKISPNVHFPPLAPTNGRAVTAMDVEASWQRVKQISSRRGEFANDVNPSAPIVSLTATDDRTIVIKLKEPNAIILSQLATNAPGTVMIAPKVLRCPKRRRAAGEAAE